MAFSLLRIFKKGSGNEVAAYQDNGLCLGCKYDLNDATLHNVFTQDSF